MATITKTALSKTSEVVVSTITLDGTDDTFTFSASETTVLVLRNDSGAGITPVIVGDEATTITVSGLGSIDVSGGYTFAEIADGTAVAIKVGVIKDYLTGTIAITGGTGLTAELLGL